MLPYDNMPRKRLAPSERRSKGLMLSLTEKEYDYIDKVSKMLGVSKIGLILSAIKKQYNKQAIQNDITNDYIALLKEQIEEYENRIKREQEVLNELKKEYNLILSLRTGGEDGEGNEDL